MIQSHALAVGAGLTALGGVNAWVADPLPTESHKVLTIALALAAGAPGGDKDEACANAGLDKITDRLN
jgi:hypothetical protein